MAMDTTKKICQNVVQVRKIRVDPSRVKIEQVARRRLHIATIYVVAYREHRLMKGIACEKCLRDDDVSIEIKIQQIFLLFFTVESLIYWRDVKKSGVVFGIGLAVLLAMSLFSLISVFSYVSLLTLLGTISFRIYKTIMSAVQKTSEGHPFK
jgi:Reticulon